MDSRWCDQLRLGACARLAAISFGLAIIGFTAFVGPQAEASQLVYTPVNPNFGGSSFNGAFLLSDAQTQNLYTPKRGPNSPLANFQRTIQSALLGRVASEIANQILGEDAQDSGQFQIDTTVINFQRIGSDIHVQIADGLTGGTTEITIPAPTF